MHRLKSLFKSKPAQRYTRFTTTASHTLLSFTSRDENRHPWWRYLESDGAPLYQMGNNCDTCALVFEGLTTAQLPIAPEELSRQLRAGLQSVPPGIVDTLAHVLPTGEYVASLLTLTPVLRRLNDPNREPYEKRHRTTYYWEGTEELTSFAYEEVVLPLVTRAQLDRAAIETYKSRLRDGENPTALALSIVDERTPHSRWYEWTLAHFLLDGHHKMMAASELGTRITLLSFLSLQGSFAKAETIDQTIALRYA